MKKKLVYSLLFLIFFAFTANAQKYFTKEGEIKFRSEAPLETIEAVNNKASSVFDSETGKIEWAVLIKAFNFEKALMQEHFNENYMESSEYPKAIFKGQINDHGSLNLETDGRYPVSVTGQLTIHGVTKDITVDAEFRVKDGVISAHSQFPVKVADYNIEIPSVVRDNIAKEVVITIDTQYQIYKKS